MASNLKGPIIVLILLAVIGVASYFAATRSKPDGEEGRTYTAILMCANPDCPKYQEAFPQAIIAAKLPPYRCKYCEKLTAYRAVRCPNCESIFPYVPPELSTGSTPEELRTTECPECGAGERWFQLIESVDPVKQ